MRRNLTSAHFSNKDGRMHSKIVIPYLFFLIICLFFTSCKNEPVEKDIYYPIEPVIKDGFTQFLFNQPAEDISIRGAWAAPVLGKNKKFYRSLHYPGGSVFFFVPQKEKYFVRIIQAGGLECQEIAVKINDHSTIHKLTKERDLFFVNPGELVQGRNELSFVLSKEQEIAIEEIEIQPRRLALLKHAPQEGQVHTPAVLNYYINPLKSEKIRLQLVGNDAEKIEAQIHIQTEKNSRQTTRLINSMSEPFDILPLDDSFHKISILLPKMRNRLGFVTLKESLVVKKRPPANAQTPGLTCWEKLQDSPLLEKNRMNVLVILLDAARADHFSCYGYKRKTTPNIDRLAEKSICFRDCYAEAAYTLASTGTLLTGLPPDYHGVTSAFYHSLDKRAVTLPELFQEKGFFTGAISGNPYFGRAYRYDQGFDMFVELFQGEKAVTAGEFIQPFEELLQKKGDRPFFIYLHIREPHTPFTMPSPYLGTFQEKYKENSPALQEEVNALYHGNKPLTEASRKLLVDLYDENLLYADAVVGKILDILKKNNLDKQTLKVILSDHGEALGEDGLIGHNVVLYREGLHIPLIIDIPGEEAGKEEQQWITKPAVTSDVVVTLAQLFDLPYPYDSFTRGYNLFRLPKGRLRISRTMANATKYYGYMLDSQPYRLIFFPPYSQGIAELYNFTIDPYEENQLTQGLETGGTNIPINYFFYYLDYFLSKAERPALGSGPVKLREKDLENLKSLGYIE